MSQCDQILAHLKSGKTLEPLYALKAFGCFRLAARIRDLREDGYPIRTMIQERHGKRYAVYWMGSK